MVARGVPAERLPDPERLTTLDEEPGGFRSLTRVLRRRESTPDATSDTTPPAADAPAAGQSDATTSSSATMSATATSSSMSSPSSAASAASGGAVDGRSGAGAPSAR